MAFFIKYFLCTLSHNYYDNFIITIQDRYLDTQKELLVLVLDEIPELYKMNNNNIVSMFKNKRVLNRLEANFVITLNVGLLELQKVNQDLLNQLKKFKID